MSKLLRMLMVGCIRLYQYTISPILGNRCRFLPTCSEYTLEAIQTHGAWKGLLLGINRIRRCHPWGDSGHDPVPEKQTKTKIDGG